MTWLISTKNIMLNLLCFCAPCTDSIWLSRYNPRIYSILTLTNYAKYFTLLQKLTHVWVDNSLIKFGCVRFGSKYSTDYTISSSLRYILNIVSLIDGHLSYWLNHLLQSSYKSISFWPHSYINIKDLEFNA